MARYINADLLLEKLKKCSATTDDLFGMGICRGIERAETSIEMIPTADVAEVKRGEWIGKPIAGYARIKCPVCLTSFVQETGTWAYCPECGAKMDGGK